MRLRSVHGGWEEGHRIQLNSAFGFGALLITVWLIRVGV
jgi:hypothetical protein